MSGFCGRTVLSWSNSVSGSGGSRSRSGSESESVIDRSTSSSSIVSAYLGLPEGLAVMCGGGMDGAAENEVGNNDGGGCGHEKREGRGKIGVGMEMYDESKEGNWRLERNVRSWENRNGNGAKGCRGMLFRDHAGGFHFVSDF